MNPTISVTAVELLQGDDMRSCSTCGEVEHVVWTIQVNQHHPEKRCTHDACWDVLDAEMGQQFAASLVTAKVSDNDLAGDVIEGVRRMLLNHLGRQDLANHLVDLWEATPHGRQTSAGRLARMRFLIGSAAFALLPSVPVPNDDDLCEAGR